VPARLFTDFINSLPPERIDIELTERTRTLSLNCARFEAKIKGIDAEEFPLVPTHLKGTTVKLDAATLCRAINQMVFAASTDESRPILTGVLLKLNNRKMVLTAADGFQIAARTVELPEAVKTPVNIVVPARALSEVARILGNNGDEGEVTMTITSARNQVLFSFPKKIDCLSAVCYTNTKGGDSNASVASHLGDGVRRRYAHHPRARLLAAEGSGKRKAELDPDSAARWLPLWRGGGGRWLRFVLLGSPGHLLQWNACFGTIDRRMQNGE
jgi:hypothetical protein